ncbi:MAG: hypothetical protein IPO14_00575 [Saprospiraceae bacterium]|nr:hypothetical protein [Saprospiraceae bacterium]
MANLKLILSLAAIVLFCTIGLFAQDSKPIYTASDQIQKLKSGFLVVMLPYNIPLRNNVAKYNQMDPASKTAKRYKKDLLKLEKDNLSWIEAMKDSYSFGPYFIMHDTAFLQFKQKPSSKYFVGGSAPLDSTIDWKSANYLIMRKGSTPEQKLDAVVINDQNFSQIPSPFPSFERTTKSASFFLILLNQPLEKPYRKIIQSFDKRLKKWYLKVSNTTLK